MKQSDLFKREVPLILHFFVEIKEILLGRRIFILIDAFLTRNAM